MERLVELSHGAPAAALILIAIVAISLIGLFAAPMLIERSLFRPHWLLPRGEYLTLVSSGFVHADLGHLLFNAITFWAFAFSLERTIGSGSFAALYFFGLLASDAGTWFKHHQEPEYRTLGASGAILAVMFASIIYFPTSSIFIMPIPVPIPAAAVRGGVSRLYLFRLEPVALAHQPRRASVGRARRHRLRLRHRRRRSAARLAALHRLSRERVTRRRRAGRSCAIARAPRPARRRRPGPFPARRSAPPAGLRSWYGSHRYAAPRPSAPRRRLRFRRTG